MSLKFSSLLNPPLRLRISGRKWFSSAATLLKKGTPKFRKPITHKPKVTGTKPSKESYNFGRAPTLHTPSKKVFNINAPAEITSFDQLNIFPSVRLAMVEQIKQEYDLKSTYIKSKEELTIKPSPIQIAAIKKINIARNKNPRILKIDDEVLTPGEKLSQELILENEKHKLKVFTLAAETGSGKTWAYLASVLSKLKNDDLDAFNQGLEYYEKQKSLPIIRSVIFVPTHELIDQVYQTLINANKIQIDTLKIDNKTYNEFFKLELESSNLGFNIRKFGPGMTPMTLFDACNDKRIDVLVTTPTKVNGLNKLTNFRRPFRYFKNANYCVVDEADTLFDESWLSDTAEVLSKMPELNDLILCSATIPKEFEKRISKFPNSEGIIKIVTPSLHKIPRSITMKIIDAQQAPYSGSKIRALAQAIYAISKDGTDAGIVKRILIFVNEKKSIEPLVNLLIDKFRVARSDIEGISGNDKPEERLEKVRPFLDPAETSGEQAEVKILVTTDVLARGLNFNGIKNIILYDIPKSGVDLLHRVGRTGRMNRAGRVFAIIDKDTNKSYIKGLPHAISKGERMG